ncbi:RluA family pseudouridine synthase [Thiomicrospira sp. ALE5]|uniref:RluA family pseudouridine synthase n=1 Tax=Thiomicrospira sp. ALE5 TaxID=748650 RepID=UPI0008ED6DD5|nr:RluA family pseudouridine synthase [Thiomicrospira sp. ALE5]SFR52196.1 23S rRNA pseudouridine955/2504/2580 synthase [Thiomicrospira sp. ALE5]
MAGVRFIEVGTEEAGQRLDNFLLKHLRKAPRPLIYRIVRKGEVRVNKGRAQVSQRLQTGDVVRVPPVKLADTPERVTPPVAQVPRIEQAILFEDDDLIVINKPPGMAVHGGSGVSWGLIELVRNARPLAKRVELVHRLDRDTSGAIILAKKMSVLRDLHQQVRDHQVTKIYWALVKGQWPKARTKVEQPLRKFNLPSGERRVEVHPAGKPSLSFVRVLADLPNASLLEVKLATGRTHQIRVHCAANGHPIAGDDKYGDAGFDRWQRQQGMTSLALHARLVSFRHPKTGEQVTLTAPLYPDFDKLLMSQRINQKDVT